MYLIRDIHNIDFFNKKFSSKPLIATIGNFDGLHLGHKEIIKKMKQIGDKDNLQSLVIFTEPHAKEFFAEQKALAGVSEDLIRISVGIEHIDDIINDVEQAIEASKK